MSDATYELARVIYEAKKQDAWGSWQSEYRKAWPKTPKLLRKCIHEESDLGVLFAIAQAKAVIAAGYSKP